MKVLLWCFWRVNSYFCTKKVSSTHFIVRTICTPSRVGSPITHSGSSLSSIPFECHTSMGFTSIRIGPTVGTKLIPYKTIKSEGYRSKGLWWFDGPKLLYTGWAHQVFFNPPPSLFITSWGGLQRSAHKTRMDEVCLSMSQPPSPCMYISCKGAPFLL